MKLLKFRFPFETKTNCCSSSHSFPFFFTSCRLFETHGRLHEHIKADDGGGGHDEHDGDDDGDDEGDDNDDDNDDDEDDAMRHDRLHQLQAVRKRKNKSNKSALSAA